MSKVAIVLCAMLFVSAANPVDKSKELESARENLLQFINNDIERYRERNNIMLNVARLQWNNISVEAKFIGQQLHNNITNQLQEAENIDTTSGIPEGLNITECTEFLADLNYTAQAIISKIDPCVESKVNDASGYLNSATETSNYLIGNFTSIRDEVQRCGNNVTAEAGIRCVNDANTDYQLTSMLLLIERVIPFGDLNALYRSLTWFFRNCVSSYQIRTFELKSSTISKKTRDCIKEKIEEAHGTRNVDMDPIKE